jgi:Ca-activated chloride channel family protein
MGEWLSWQWFNPHTLQTFEWANPLYLYGLGLLPVLFWLRRLIHNRSRQKLVIAFLDRDVPTSWVRYLRFIPALLQAAAVALVIVALARPQRSALLTERISAGIDITLALDISDSMLETDLLPNRLTAAKRVAEAFVRGRFQDRIGLVAFAGESHYLCPLTTDYELLYQLLTELSLRDIRTAGTAIGSALANCVNLMRTSNSPSKVAILLSDGDNTAGNLDPRTAAQLAQAYGIRVYTVAVGRAGTRAETVDEGTLREIATLSSGRFFRAVDGRALTQIFRQIDQLEKAEIRQGQYREVKDFYHVYLRWAVVFFLLALLSKLTFLGNILED